jgi:hypothetical protein
MIMVTIGWGLAATLYILGGRLVADWIPHIENSIKRPLYFSEKAKLVTGWPVMELMGLFSKESK